VRARAAGARRAAPHGAQGRRRAQGRWHGVCVSVCVCACVCVHTVLGAGPLGGRGQGGGRRARAGARPRVRGRHCAKERGAARFTHEQNTRRPPWGRRRQASAGTPAGGRAARGRHRAGRAHRPGMGNAGTRALTGRAWATPARARSQAGHGERRRERLHLLLELLNVGAAGALAREVGLELLQLAGGGRLGLVVARRWGGGRSGVSPPRLFWPGEPTALRRAPSLAPTKQASRRTWQSLAITTARWMNSATCSNSASPKPRVVSAGVPMRMPPGTMALLSPGTLFLFRVLGGRAGRAGRGGGGAAEVGGRRRGEAGWAPAPARGKAGRAASAARPGRGPASAPHLPPNTPHPAHIDTRSSTLCTRAPSMPLGLRSTRMRWLSVPPDTTA
jgi:hypothetical protein